MRSPPSRPPDWRHHAWLRVRHAWFTPMTSGAKQAVATLFVVVLALFAVDLLFTAHEVGAVRAADAKSARAAASVMQLCQAGNESRAQQVGLWEYVLRLSGPPRTALEARVRAEFDHHLHAVFAPRDCAAPLTTRRQP